MKKLFLALGSNLGDREEHLQHAADRIAEAGVHLLRASSTYETKPMYLTGQPMFLNLVLEGETGAFPRMLLKRLKTIEREMGRRQTVQNGPRIIDIDILFFGRFIVHTPELLIPHPKLPERRFVLEPLAELVPEWRHPVTKRTMRELLAQLPEGGVRKVEFVVQLERQKSIGERPL
ncbi:MAG: 2-amino-4-hydroxy-6-hydroxymethyldihydropteridine diphosphokinase [Bryobacterales bacterium]|nr:2-amino-4-hydroxy-6-hydroxymethyldihydropteridine diphosphokinase [Bryobacterales bacterium]